MKFAIVLSLLSLLHSCSAETQQAEKIDSCSMELEAQGVSQMYRTILTRRSVPCTVTVFSNQENIVKIEFHNLKKACDLKPDSVVVLEEGSGPVSMCDSAANVYISGSPKIQIQYFSSTGVAFEISEVRNKIGCTETLDYNYYGRSLTLTSSSKNETCVIAFPGRTRVIMEQINLEKDKCESHVNIMTGRDFFTYNYRLKQYCKADNGPTDDETLVVCPRGLLLFQSASAKPETIRFRLEIPANDRPLLIHSLEC